MAFFWPVLHFGLGLVLLFYVQRAANAADSQSYPFDSPNDFATANGNGAGANPIKSYSTTSGQSVKVFDSAIDERALRKLSDFSFAGEWTFQHRDGAAGGELDEGSQSMVVAGGNTPWSKPLNAKWFASTVVGKSLTSLLAANWPAAGALPLLPYDARFLALRRGDDTAVQSGTDGSLGEVWSVVHMTRKQWQNNMYGETLLFDEMDEVVAACQPKFGRVVAWDAGLSYLLRPPSIAHIGAQYVLVIRWTKNESLVTEMEAKRELYDAETRQGLENGLFTTGDRSIPADLDVSKYETQHVVTRTEWKKNVHVFDDLLNQSDVDELRLYAKRYGNFDFRDYVVNDEGADNVQWVGVYDVQSFIQSKYWKIIQKVVEYVSGGQTSWYPYDVACNVVRSSDHTRIHGDVRNDVDTEWTLLIYLSPDWNANSYGETAWFTGSEGDGMTHDVDLETEVQPIYGRVSIFEGLIPHAARPPSASYRGPRYSFAVKMAANQWLSSRNLIMEEFHEKMDVLGMLVASHPKPGSALKLTDNSGSFNAQFAKRYWTAFLTGRDDVREQIIQDMLGETEGDGVKLNSLLDYLVRLLKSQMSTLLEEGRKSL